MKKNRKKMLGRRKVMMKLMESRRRAVVDAIGDVKVLS